MIDHERDPDPVSGPGTGEGGGDPAHLAFGADSPSAFVRPGADGLNDTEPDFLPDDDVMPVSDIDANWESFKQRFESWPPPDAGIAYPVRSAEPVIAERSLLESRPSLAPPLRRSVPRPRLAPLSTRRPVRFWSWAAAATVLSVGAYASWQRFTSPSAPAAVTSMHLVYTGGTGDRSAEQRLPDGTRFRLAPHSTLTVDGSWAHERTMQLVGDAYFDVASDVRPFIVRSTRSVTRVLGTKFFVSASQYAVADRVGVLSGRVAVASDKNPTQMSVVNSGYVGNVAKSGKTTVAFDPNIEQNIGWIDGGFVMRAMPLAEALDHLAERFDFHVQVAPGSKLDQARINGVIPADFTLYESLKALKMTVGLRYVWYGNTLVVARLPYHALVHEKPVEWMPPDSVAVAPPARLAPPVDSTPELLRGGSARGGLTLAPVSTAE